MNFGIFWKIISFRKSLSKHTKVPARCMLARTYCVRLPIFLSEVKTSFAIYHCPFQHSFNTSRSKTLRKKKIVEKLGK